MTQKTGQKILVVEDDPVMAKMLRVLLEGEGYRVLSAENGAKALELFRDPGPDLILLDLMLPDIDGIELCKKFRTHPNGQGIPIIAVSGFQAKMDLAKTMLGGFTDYLFKPVESSQLLRTIQTYLPKPKVEAAPEAKVGRGRTVLIADDDSLQRKLLEIHLQELGFKVLTAGNGEDALEQARRTPPDAIISDVIMPGLDGFGLCQAVRGDGRLARTPIVLTSVVYVEGEDQARARSAGANALVLRTHDNRETIKALLDQLDKTSPAPKVPSASVPAPQRPERQPSTQPAAGDGKGSDYSLKRQVEQHTELNISLAQRLALREAEVAIMQSLMETLQKTSRLEAVLEVLLRKALDAAGVSNAAAYLRDQNGKLVLRALAGYPGSPNGPAPDFASLAKVMEYVIDADVPLAVPASRAPEYAKAHGAIRSLLIAPLAAGSDRLGVLIMGSTQADLSEDWVAFAQSIGEHVGRAVALARTLAKS